VVYYARVLFSMLMDSVEMLCSGLAPVTSPCDCAIVSPAPFNNLISMAWGMDWKLISRPQTDWAFSSFSTSTHVREHSLFTLVSALSMQAESLLDCPGCSRTTIVVLYWFSPEALSSMMLPVADLVIWADVVELAAAVEAAAVVVDQVVLEAAAAREEAREVCLSAIFLEMVDDVLDVAVSDVSEVVRADFCDTEDFFTDVLVVVLDTSVDSEADSAAVVWLLVALADFLLETLVLVVFSAEDVADFAADLSVADLDVVTAADLETEEVAEAVDAVAFAVVVVDAADLSEVDVVEEATVFSDDVAADFVAADLVADSDFETEAELTDFTFKDFESLRVTFLVSEPLLLLQEVAVAVAATLLAAEELLRLREELLFLFCSCFSSLVEEALADFLPRLVFFSALTS